MYISNRVKNVTFVTKDHRADEEEYHPAWQRRIAALAILGRSGRFPSVTLDQVLMDAAVTGLSRIRLI